MLLEHDGHEVCAVDCGEAALAELAQRKFDLVITDFSMPGMHGDQLVSHIRRLAPNQPIIMITAFVEEYKTFGQASGQINALLLKPFSFKELREAIERVLTPEQVDRPGDLPLIARPSPPLNFTPPPEP